MTALFTFKKLHVHSSFLEINSFTPSGLKFLEERFRRKQVIPRTMPVQGNRTHSIHVIFIYAQSYLYVSRGISKMMMYIVCTSP